ncbi:MAG: VWA domain-containing protein, partial [Mesorhizobium sp.]
IHKYGPDYKVIVVGDASMSPYEIAHPGGSVEHWNPEAGGVWLGRLLQQWPNAIWLNPESQKNWGYTHSIGMIRDIFGGRMFPLTLAGLEAATKQLSRRH